MAIKRVITTAEKERNSVHVLQKVSKEKAKKEKRPNMEYVKERFRILNMKVAGNLPLNKEEKAELEELTPIVKRSTQGRTSKQKGSKFERDVAKKFRERYQVELVRTPQSGGFVKNSEKAEEFRGDILPVEKDIQLLLHIECKNQKTWKLNEWMNQSKSDCPKGKVPIVIFHKHNTGENFVTLTLEDFLSLVEENKVLRRRKE